MPMEESVLRYRIRAQEVDAIRIRCHMRIRHPHGTYVGKPGDWLVNLPSGRQEIIPDEEFVALADPLTDAARAELETRG